MRDLLFLGATPVLVALAARSVGVLRSLWGCVATLAVAALAPPLLVVLLTREADAITNAAAIQMTPLFFLYGLILGGFAIAIARPR